MELTKSHAWEGHSPYPNAITIAGFMTLISIEPNWAIESPINQNGWYPKPIKTCSSSDRKCKHQYPIVSISKDNLFFLYLTTDKRILTQRTAIQKKPCDSNIFRPDEEAHHKPSKFIRYVRSNQSRISLRRTAIDCWRNITSTTHQRELYESMTRGIDSFIRPDGHPTEYSNRIITEELVRRIGAMEGKWSQSFIISHVDDICSTPWGIYFSLRQIFSNLVPTSLVQALLRIVWNINVVMAPSCVMESTHWPKRIRCVILGFNPVVHPQFFIDFVCGIYEFHAKHIKIFLMLRSTSNVDKSMWNRRWDVPRFPVLQYEEVWQSNTRRVDSIGPTIEWYVDQEVRPQIFWNSVWKSYNQIFSPNLNRHRYYERSILQHVA